jgi:hypothetical protein
MGRKALMDPAAARRALAMQIREAMSVVDAAEVQARFWETQMVDLLAGMATDATLADKDLPVARFRAEMALHVLDRARGRPAQKAYLAPLSELDGATGPAAEGRTSAGLPRPRGDGPGRAHRARARQGAPPPARGWPL